MRTIVQALMLGLGFLSFNAAVFSQQVAKKISYPASPDGVIGFLEFRPSDYGSQKHPLIIFLHGIGERGNGGSQIGSVTANAIPRFCANGASMRFTYNGQTSSFVVLSPQLSSQYGYWPPYYIKEMIKYAKANLQVDPDRIYLTGLSLGGGGVWRAITDADNWDYTFNAGIAAVAPVCGTQEMNDATYCGTIGANHLPIWAFHSMDDGVVGVGQTQHGEWLSNICGVTPASKFTYYKNGGHVGAWIYAYDTGHITTTLNGGASFTANPNMYEWFLSHTRSTGASPVYTPPVANAGAAQVITLPLNVVTLAGSGAGTNGATIASWSWTKTSGPSGGTIGLPYLNTTPATGLVQGTYVFRLTVTDNHGLTNSSNVTITVNAAAAANQYPVANAGSDIVLTLPDNNTVLNGLASTDPDGTIVKYHWVKLSSGPGYIADENAARTDITGLAQGYYQFSLQVTDNKGASGYSNVNITVNAAAAAAPLPNQYPVASAGQDITLTLPTNSYTLDATASYDPDGSIVKYHWLKLSSGPGNVSDENSARTTVTGLAQGYHEFSLKVIDNSGFSSYDNLVIIVNPAPAGTGGAVNNFPVANAGQDVTLTLPASSYTLNATSSYDPDGAVVRYHWLQLSGGPAIIADEYAATTSITGLAQGYYEFSLEIVDNNGASGYDNIIITVNPAASSASEQPAGYIKESVGPYQACEDASSSGRIAVYCDGIANGHTLYTDAEHKNLFNGGWNWFSFTPVPGGQVTQAFAVFPDGTIHLIMECYPASPPVAEPAPPPPSTFLGYIKMSVGPYQACDDASTSGRIPVYGTNISNGSYLYTDAALTQKYDGGWNWFSFTPVLGGPVSHAFAIYPIGSMGLLMNCYGARVVAAGQEAPAVVQEAAPAAAAGKLSMYPNPVRTDAVIELNNTGNAGMKTIHLYNSGGILKATYTWPAIKGKNIFSLKNISGLPGGLYIIDIRDTDGKPAGTLKFVKL